MILRKELEECASSPCLNNGTCVEQINSYLCECTEGFTGVNCEIGRQITDVCIIMVVLKNAFDSFVKSSKSVLPPLAATMEHALNGSTRTVVNVLRDLLEPTVK